MSCQGDLDSMDSSSTVSAQSSPSMTYSSILTAASGIIQDKKHPHVQAVLEHSRSSIAVLWLSKSKCPRPYGYYDKANIQTQLLCPRLGLPQASSKQLNHLETWEHDATTRCHRQHPAPFISILQLSFQLREQIPTQEENHQVRKAPFCQLRADPLVKRLLPPFEGMRTNSILLALRRKAT